MRAQHSHRLSALHEERLLVAQRAQRGADALERGPVPRRLAAAAVDDQLLGLLRHLGIEVVLQHAQGRFLHPPFAGPRGAARGADDMRHAVWITMPPWTSGAGT